MEILLVLVGIIALIPLLVLYSSFSWGFVATIIYKWFVLPLFPQFPVLTWIQFAGIMFFINCFVHGFSQVSNIKKEYRDELNGFITLILAPWLTLFGAYILHLFY